MAIESSGTEDDTQVTYGLVATQSVPCMYCSAISNLLVYLQWLVYWLLYSLLQGFEKFAWPVLQW